MNTKRFIAAVFVALLLSVLFFLFWNYGGNVHFRISRNGWYVGAGFHEVVGSDGKLHRCGRSVHVGPFICDYFYGQPVGDLSVVPPTMNPVTQITPMVNKEEAIVI